MRLRLTGRQAGRQAGRQTGRQAGRHPHREIETERDLYLQSRVTLPQRLLYLIPPPAPTELAH